MNKKSFLSCLILLSSLSASSFAKEYTPYYVFLSANATEATLKSTSEGSATSSGFNIGGGLNLKNEERGGTFGVQFEYADYGNYEDGNISQDLSAFQLTLAGQFPLTDYGLGIAARSGLNFWSSEGNVSASSMGTLIEVGPYYETHHFRFSLSYLAMPLSDKNLRMTVKGLNTGFLYQF